MKEKDRTRKDKKDTEKDIPFTCGTHDYICPFCGVSHANELCRFTNLYELK